MEYSKIRNLSADEIMGIYDTLGYKGMGEWVITYKGEDIYMDEADYNDLLSTLAFAYVEHYKNSNT